MINALDRKIAPKFKRTENIGIIKPELTVLDNGAPLYIIDSGSEEIISLEVIFEAGAWFDEKPLVSVFTNSMLTEGGTIDKNAYEISEMFEFYGANIQAHAGKDTSSVSLSSMNKHLNELLPLLECIIYEPAFPENELAIQLVNSKQKFLINLEKPSVIAGRTLNSLVLGNNNPYGYLEALADFDNINSSLLIDFHRKYYRNGKFAIIASGKVNKDFVKLINKYFGNKSYSGELKDDFNYSFISHSEKRNLIVKNGAVQDSLRIGKQCITRKHPDWHGLKVLITLLGGYFGSRLMKNIREDKGLTYGIYAYLQGLRRQTSLVVGAETAGGNGRQAADEVYFELNKLANELVPDEELELVKNYLLGEIQRGFDGPLASAEMYKNIIKNNLPEDFYQQYINVIINCSALDMKELAIKYLNPDSMLELIVADLK